MSVIHHSSLDVKMGGISTSWNKGFSDEHNLATGHGQGTVAISAFHLSEAKGDVERKDLVKQMWNSGAETIVSTGGIIPLRLLMPKLGSHRSRYKGGVLARH